VPDSERLRAPFPTAMLSEIYEQPRALSATLDAYVRGTELRSEVLAAIGEALRRHQRLVVAASGSSRHAGLAGEIMLEDLAGVAVDVEYASEYSYRSTYTLQDPAVIAISQSGETADTLAALRVANTQGLSTVAIANVAASTMTREASAAMPTFAGTERAIPATKSFTAQLMALYILTLLLGRERAAMPEEAMRRRLGDARAAIARLESAIPAWDRAVDALASRYAGAQTLLYLGRGVHYAIAREGALKMKESSYVHAEGYPAGELKHGPNALVSDRVPLVVIATRDPEDHGSTLRYSKTLQLLRDLRAQHARILALASEGDADVAEVASDTVFIPEASEYLLPLCEVIPLQILAHHCARLNGVDVDRPRNLVKAVVQE
jgi:glucosamine--fructose-6-phosphate aminotransferase (isomerizing)